jgi:hypothetical protein
MRTWKCPQCGHSEDITYEWLAEHGGPICGDCDCDMTLQPEAEAADDRGAVVQQLAEKAAANGLEAEHLDGLVHELAASIAADINNAGLEDQVRYLVTELGAQHTERQLDELIQGHANPSQEDE